MIAVDHSVARGWLRKACRFGIMHHLKHRYFVLLNTELRYYKHPDDTHPAGIIDLEDFCDVHQYNTSQLYGFKLEAKSKGHWIPMLYASSEEERARWIHELRQRLDSMENYSESFSPTTVDNDDISDQYSVLDKWLYKLNLYDSDKDSIISCSSTSSHQHHDTSSQSSPKHSRHHSRSNSGSSGHMNLVSSFNKNRSMESVEASIHTEPDSYGNDHSSNHSSSNSTSRQSTSSFHSFNSNILHSHLFDNHHFFDRANGHHLLDKLTHHNTENPPKRQTAKRASTLPIYNSTNNYTKHDSRNIKKQLSLESEQRKYTEITSHFNQHPHQNHAPSP